MENFKIINIIPAANIPAGRNQIFSYLCDKNQDIMIGQEVLIPLRNKKIRGVVLGVNHDRKDTKKLKHVVDFVDEKQVMSQDMISLAEWISENYCVSLGLVIKAMLFPRTKRRKEIDIIKKTYCEKFPELTERQSKIYKQIVESDNSRFLLHGVTGAGKTEIYMTLIREAIENEKQTILLVPEISLTPQNIQRFSNRFGADNIAILHSRLTAAEKYTQWENIREGTAKIVIGPRSAIFAPAFNLGLIIVDEEHDTSFKQYDQNPRYHAREVAIKLAEIKNCKILLGSATPSLDSYHKAQQKDYQLLEMMERYNGENDMPEVQIIDMKEEFKKRNFSIFSEDLQSGFKDIIARRKQALIFVNRRGASTFVMCRDCGHTMNCPNCDISLTYHINQNNAQKNILICHHCDHREASPLLCPKCNSQFIKYFGVGTQRVEFELKKLFPNIRIARMDGDTTKSRSSHESIYKDFEAHKYDVLIGTQMITKGWDLSNIDLVGIISADTLFNFPDFKCNERAFQVLTQVEGRTGRGIDKGKVILQTYNPENEVVKNASRHDYFKFYSDEIAERKELDYPPFRKIIKLIFEDTDYNKVRSNAERVSKELREHITKEKLDIDILGPAPAYLARVRNRFRWNLILKLKHGVNMPCKVLNKFSDANIKIDINPEDLL